MPNNNSPDNKLYKLTVIMRDCGPLIHMNEPVAHRTVVIELTPHQSMKLKLKYTHEEIGLCFLEEQDNESR